MSDLESQYSKRIAQSWSDREPDILTISVCTSAKTGEPFVVFTCSSTWLDADVVGEEVIPHLQRCVDQAKLLKTHHHDEHCCSLCDLHTTPHKGCILR